MRYRGGDDGKPASNNRHGSIPAAGTAVGVAGDAGEPGGGESLGARLCGDGVCRGAVLVDRHSVGYALAPRLQRFHCPAAAAALAGVHCGGGKVVFEGLAWVPSVRDFAEGEATGVDGFDSHLLRCGWLFFRSVAERDGDAGNEDGMEFVWLLSDTWTGGSHVCDCRCGCRCGFGWGCG